MDNIGSDVLIEETDLSTILNESEEWLIIDYLLQICTRTSRVKLKVARQIQSPKILNLFEKRCSGCTLTFCFIEAKSGGDNSISEVCRRGFKIGSDGMKISVGNFSLPGFPLMRGGPDEKGDPYMDQEKRKKKRDLFIETAKTRLLTGERRIFDYFLCDVGIGQSYVSQTEKDAPKPLPKGYDSCLIKHSETKKEKDSLNENALTVHYLSNTNLQFFRDPNIIDSSVNVNNFRHRNVILNNIISPTHLATAGVLPQYTFYQEYIIYDSTQIIPRYLIQIECDPSVEERFAVPLCDNCQDAPATQYCNADRARLCEPCSDRIHSLNKTSQKHIRVSLNDMPRPFGRCCYHKEMEYEMFCDLCHLPVCCLCRPNHTHTDISGKSYMNAASSLIPIKTAYQSILEKVKQPHFILQTRKENLQPYAIKMQNLINDVRHNFEEVEQKCYAICEEALQQLHQRTEEKMSVLWGDELEKSRQFNELEWAESFLDYLKSVLPPPDFLMAWLRHCRLRREMTSVCCGTSQLSNNILADMQLEGKVEVLLESSKNLRDKKNQKNLKT